jgi:hypothetical protein
LVKAAHTLKVKIGSVLAKVIRSTNRRERERERKFLCNRWLKGSSGAETRECRERERGEKERPR